MTSMQQASPSASWSRSRYWLCHFLHNRHVRHRVNWEASTQQTSVLPAGALTGLIHRLRAPQPGLLDVIATSESRCAADPAFVQSLRLFARERSFHHDLVTRLLRHHHPAAVLPDPSGMYRDQLRKEVTASVLGMRYFLASLLLDDVIDLGVLRLVQKHHPHGPAQDVCQVLLHDKSLHAAFLAERLTLEYADFNFIRRNLRRMRLRGLFVVHLKRVLTQDRELFKTSGVSRASFAMDAWRRFECVLETMVPYRRDMLLRTLRGQSEKPYEHASLPALR